MELNEILDVRIEKLTNLGVGLARIEGFVIFVENTCPEDFVKIKISKINKNFAIGTLIEILQNSPHRVKPFCKMQKVCGSCQLQFIDYEYQLEIKQNIVKEALKTIGNIDLDVPKPIPSPQIEAYRHKIQYPISQTTNSKRILAGYYKPKTHEIVNIKHCPIQPQICDDIINFVRENAKEYNINAYNESNNKGLLRHVVIRYSQNTNKNLVILVINSKKCNQNIINFCNLLYTKFEDVSGVCLNHNTSNSNVIMGKDTTCICGESYIYEKLSDKIFKIGATTFFQVNPLSATNIFEYVKDFIHDKVPNATVLDAYAGISTFGIFVSDICSKVVTVEENSESVKLAKDSAKLNNIENISINECDASKFLKNQKDKFDIVILDPPRKGCTKLSLDESYRLAKKFIIYVSCNPATLARDLKYLKEKGAIIECIQPFDMFCHTYHVENVVIIRVN